MRSHRQSMRDNIRDRNCTFVRRWNRILALSVGRKNRPHIPRLDQGKQLFGMPWADRTRMDRAHQRPLCLSVFHMPPITQMVASDTFFRPTWLGCRGRTHTRIRFVFQIQLYMTTKIQALQERLIQILVRPHIAFHAANIHAVKALEAYNPGQFHGEAHFMTAIT